jgi:hypothetical protein
MNFVVIENKESNVDMGSFEDEYLHSTIMNEELRVKYGLSKLEFRNLTQKIKERLGVSRRPNVAAKYYYVHCNAWVIHRKINGELVYYGRIPFSMGEETLNQALQICEANNWECEKCKKLIRELKQCN